MAEVCSVFFTVNYYKLGEIQSLQWFASVVESRNGANYENSSQCCVAIHSLLSFPVPASTSEMNVMIPWPKMVRDSGEPEDLINSWLRHTRSLASHFHASFLQSQKLIETPVLAIRSSSQRGATTQWQHNAGATYPACNELGRTKWLN